MIWRDDELKNPFSGKFLKRDSPHSFSDGENRFPIVEEIPFLRANREELRAAALRKLDAGETRGALILLLQDRDDWAGGEPPTETDLQPLFENENLTLRAAMRHLRYGAVADYFAYRWSDPTFLSGLCLLDWHLPNNGTSIFELCCGIGHYLRELALRDFTPTGADVVFSKLWLARKFVAPAAKLICFDANADFPLAEKVFDSAFCHDAFYFLPKKRYAASELERTTRGAILIGHAHNSEADNFSSGAAVSVGEYAEMFEESILYDDAELTKSCLENRKPEAKTVNDLRRAAAIAIVEKAEYKSHADFTVPFANRKLRLNPLLWDEETKSVRQTPLFPTERYENEYAPLSDYLYLDGKQPTQKDLLQAETEGWSNRAKLLKFARRRVFLDLPENW